MANLIESISASKPKEKQTFDDDIANIKSEIANLNAKFDDKLNKIRGSEIKAKGATKESAAHAKNKNSKERDNKFTKKTKGIERDAGVSAGKPRVVKEKDASFPRSSSVEGSIYPAWWGYFEPATDPKNNKKLTPKITETEAPQIPRVREKVPTRHHLDDEVGRSFFNDKTEDSAVDDHPSHEINNLQAANTNSIEEAGQMTGSFRGFNQENHAKLSNHHEHVPEKSQSQSNHFISASKQREVSNKQTQKNQDKSRNTSSRPQSRDRTLFLSHASIPPEKKQQPAHNPKYNHILSKIKDKVDLDRQLSNQYKKVKGVLNDRSGDKGDSFQSGEFTSLGRNQSSTEYPSRDKSRNLNQSKFIFLDKGDNRNIYSKSPIERGSPNQPKKDSNIIHEDSHLINAQSDEIQPRLTDSNSLGRNQREFSPDYQLNRRPLQDSFNKGGSNEQYSANKSDESSQFRDSGYIPQGKHPYSKVEPDNQYNSASNAGGNPTNVLEIANNFINSPLMHHLSSQEQRNSDNSFKGSSSFPNTLKSNANVPEFDTRSPSPFTRSPNSRHYYDEDLKNSEEKGHRYSDWAGSYEFSKSKDQPSYIKESRNKRFSDYKRDDSDASFSSSNFSNFNLNEDMKGFYQNIFWEQTKTNEKPNFRRGEKDDLEDENFANESHDDGRYQNDRSLRYKGHKGEAYNNSYVSDYGKVNRSNQNTGAGGSGYKAGRSTAGRYGNYP